MVQLRTPKKKWPMLLIGMVVIGLMLTGIPPAMAHGGKSHGGVGFTAFQAVQKASQLYDRLITSGKLDGAWETGLSSITVNIRQSAGQAEFVVKFLRTEGTPNSVFFFFDSNGEYSGSNFSGN